MLLVLLRLVEKEKRKKKNSNDVMITHFRRSKSQSTWHESCDYGM